MLRIMAHHKHFSDYTWKLDIKMNNKYMKNLKHCRDLFRGSTSAMESVKAIFLNCFSTDNFLFDLLHMCLLSIFRKGYLEQTSAKENIFT